MTHKTKDRLIIMGCALGSLVCCLDLIWAVTNTILVVLGKQTIFYPF